MADPQSNHDVTELLQAWQQGDAGALRRLLPKRCEGKVPRFCAFATDSHGASSAFASIVTVADQSAPVISDLAVDTPVLSPSHHRMELVTIAYTAADNCGPVSTELMISSNDSDSDDSDERRRPDWQVIAAHHVSLRAEREGHRDRFYWITVVATDGAGNHSAGSVVVRVPGRPR